MKKEKWLRVKTIVEIIITAVMIMQTVAEFVYFIAQLPTGRVEAENAIYTLIFAVFITIGIFVYKSEKKEKEMWEDFTKKLAGETLIYRAKGQLSAAEEAKFSVWSDMLAESTSFQIPTKKAQERRNSQWTNSSGTR